MINKIILLFIFVLFSTYTLQAQDTGHKKILFGTEYGGLYVFAKDPDTAEKFRWSTTRLAPYIGIFLNNNFIIGITGEYEFVKSNVEAIPPPLYGFGSFIRYYLPFRIKNDKLKDRLLFFGEFSYNRVNHYPKPKGEVIVFDHLQETIVRLNIGLSIRLWKQLHLDISIRPQIYLGRKAEFTRRSGFEYHF